MPLKEQIRQFIVSELISDGKSSDLNDSVLLIESGIIDSLGIMALIGYLEEKFTIEIAGEDLVPENFASVATINDFILQKSTQQTRDMWTLN